MLGTALSTATLRRATQAVVRIENWSMMGFLKAIGVVVPIIAFLAGAARWVNAHPTRAEVDSAYVRRYDFAIYQQGQVTLRMRDSLIQDARDVRRDSLLSSLYRACQHRRECP